MKNKILRVGIAGLGRAGIKLLPWLTRANRNELEGLVLSSIADHRADARHDFERIYGKPAYATVAELCQSPNIDVVYIATPSSFHCEHTLEAVRAGKHVLCEKPLATSLSDCDLMIQEAQDAGVLLVQGHSKVFDPSVKAMRQVIDTGRIGTVFQVDTWNFNDWMRRPRLVDELDTTKGGGVVLRQGPPLIDLIRILIGRVPQTVRAVSGRYATGLDTEGNFSALVGFEDGIAATVSFNGYGHFDLVKLFGQGSNAVVRETFPTGPVDTNEKYKHLHLRANPPTVPLPTGGLTIVAGSKGILVDSPIGLHLYCNGEYENIPLPDTFGRAAGLIELRDALYQDRPCFPDGVWAKTTLEICLAILESSRQGKDISIVNKNAI